MLLFVNVDLVSESNVREHWGPKNTRKRKQRKAVRMAWIAAGKPKLPKRFTLSLVRVHTSRRKIKDFDNLVGCFKAVIDEIADIAGINDKDITWPIDRRKCFAQEQGEIMGCKIKIETLENVGEDLTKLQSTFLRTWVLMTDSVGYPPTLAELEQGESWNAQQLMQYVVSKGYLEKKDGIARACRLTEKGKKWKLVKEL